MSEYEINEALLKARVSISVKNLDRIRKIIKIAIDKNAFSTKEMIDVYKIYGTIEDAIEKILTDNGVGNNNNNNNSSQSIQQPMLSRQQPNIPTASQTQQSPQINNSIGRSQNTSTISLSSNNSTQASTPTKKSIKEQFKQNSKKIVSQEPLQNQPQSQSSHPQQSQPFQQSSQQHDQYQQNQQPPPFIPQFNQQNGQNGQQSFNNQFNNGQQQFNNGQYQQQPLSPQEQMQQQQNQQMSNTNAAINADLERRFGIMPKGNTPINMQSIVYQPNMPATPQMPSALMPISTVTTSQTFNPTYDPNIGGMNGIGANRMIV